MNMWVKGALFGSHAHGSVLGKLKPPNVSITYPTNLPYGPSQDKRQESSRKMGPDTITQLVLLRQDGEAMTPSRWDPRSLKRSIPLGCPGPAGALGSKPSVCRSNLEATLAAPWGKWP